MKPNPNSPSDNHSLSSLQKPMISRLAFSLLFFIFLFLINLGFLYFFTSIRPSPCPSPCTYNPLPTHLSEPEPKPVSEETGLRHVVFGIGSSRKHLARRRHFIRIWWRPNSTRGFIFLDHPVNLSEPTHLPELKVSDDTSQFGYSDDAWRRATLRMTRIVLELVRMRLEDVRWFVMGDDDTMFYPDNLLRVLKKYDHTRMYYIGSNSETHFQNIRFSNGMAFGGGGFAISYPLAKAMEKMLDGCIQRYPDMIGLDDRIHACMSELGVPLTREPGFHQLDVYGNLFGLLAAHPVTPLVSIHHLEKVHPIFPSMNRLRAFIWLSFPAKVDSAGLMQQSICYDPPRNWTVSVSWGYAVQIIRGWIPAHEMERPARTFYNWKRTNDPAGFSINTRPWSKHPCEEPYVYFLSNVVMNIATNVSWSEYIIHRQNHTWCSWKVESPQKIFRVEVYKKPNPHKWDETWLPDDGFLISIAVSNELVDFIGRIKYQNGGTSHEVSADSVYRTAKVLNSSNSTLPKYNFP
ncbi:hypothetical protein Cgig2_002341 [Carnegiea gigantea]|uniref:Uncharacterized protein n=1 Tax=Carnegiea gigantea TaxID=171969 RepID=A0A9Q1JYW9_9CARY|nr:hypothetical protein Cgig2_002341 [Carnegiea gigantea]